MDTYHAKSNEYVYWNINNRPGKMRFTYTIGLHNHSGDVYMQYFETTGAPILVQWRLRLRQDFNLADDLTLFTYPLVEGSTSYVQSYTEHEGRYGDGYNQMPYVTGAKVFWDSYNLSLRYAGTLIRPLGTLQSDRATCYKTVSCKFI